MNTFEAHIILLGPALLLTAVLAALIWRGKGPHPATYTLSEQWTHEPILWASEEPADHGHAEPTGRSMITDSAQGAPVHEGHGAHLVTIGGGASGTW